MNKFVFLVLSLAVVFAQCELNDQKLSLVLGELLDLRTELNELFQSPRKSYDNEEPDAEWVVHIGRGVAEAQWLANLTNTQLVGPVITLFFICTVYNIDILDERFSRAVRVQKLCTAQQK